MAHMIVSKPQGLTPEVAKGMVGHLEPKFKEAQGFIFHASGPADGGWGVVEVWESKEDWQRWFDDTIQPMLPPEVDSHTEHHDIDYAVER